MSEPLEVRTLLATMAELPGVYRMLDGEDNVLYVGKAKNLRKRVASYFRDHHASPRVALMLTQVARVETTVTRSEGEALLLENNLIKSLAPRYNIVFRDDKSYPYIVLTHDDYPRLGFFRGATDRRADYFGPFPSAPAVRESIHLLQKMFRLRTCENAVFRNRSRACLLHQIQRCSAPCVGLVARQQYAQDVQMAVLFLQGRQHDVIARLSAAMDRAAATLAFEVAAVYRDQIQSLRQVQERQYVDSGKDGDVDIVVAVADRDLLCVNLAMVRGGRHLGDKPQFPGNAADCSPLEALTAFLSQHYLAHPAPPRILVNRLPGSDRPVEQACAGSDAPRDLTDALRDIADSLRDMAQRPLRIGEARLATQRVWVEMAEQNARLAIVARRAALSRQGDRVRALREALALDDDDGREARIECFDVSHTQGQATVAACVVYQGDGMRRSEYRRFNIEQVAAGDDYAAMRQVVRRRYDKVAAGDGVAPTLILIDGGSGQVNAAAGELAELGLGHLPLLGVAKGEARKPGLETLIFADHRQPLQLPPEHPALHLIQEIRDEAHRFAVSGHRNRRAKAARASRLDEIAGVGPQRRKALLARFGGVQGIVDAGVDQLTAVPGISRELAERIFGALH